MPIYFLMLLSMFWQTGNSMWLSPGMTTVSGHVYYKDGSPVINALVELHTYAPEGAIEPPNTTYTDIAGRYSIAYPPLGEAAISASKVTEGYPDAVWALYGRGNHTSVRKINLRVATLLDNIDLRLENPQPIVEFHIVDAKTLQPLQDARMLAELSDDPKIVLSQTVPDDGIIAFVLPKHSIKMKITAPGHAEWIWISNQVNEAKLQSDFHRTVVAALK